MTNETNVTENVIIIGGGPAGLAAALYCARANLNPVVFAGSPPGGQLMLTSEVENYPGIESMLGPEIIQKYRDHALKFGTKIIDQNITKVDFTRSPFTVSTAEKSYSSQTVLIATGAQALWLNLPNEQRLRGKGVSACATCDGFFFKDKTVAVVGGGDTAMEEALTLTKFATKVYIIHRRDAFRASKIMQDRVLTNKKIEVMWNTAVDDVVGENQVEGIKLQSLQEDAEQNLSRVNSSPSARFARSGSSDNNSRKFSPASSSSGNKTLNVDGLFLAIGHKPDTNLFKGHIELDEKGYIITADRLAFDNFKLQTRLPDGQVSNDKSISNLKNENSKFIENWLAPRSPKGEAGKMEIGNFPSATSANGVFAAGDCVDYKYRQAGTAVGMGIAAALDVQKFLEVV